MREELGSRAVWWEDPEVGHSRKWLPSLGLEEHVQKPPCQSPEDRWSQDHGRGYQAETVAAEKEAVRLVRELVEESQPLPEMMAQEIAVAEGG